MKAIFTVIYDVAVDKSTKFLEGQNAVTVFSDKDAEDAIKKARKHLIGKRVPVTGQEGEHTITNFKLLGVQLAATAVVD